MCNFKIVREAVDKLDMWIERNNWKAYDPYDGLNSPVAKFLKNKYWRILLTQIFKRSPVNVRRLLGISKEYNPKAMGLFADSYLINYKCTEKHEYLKKTAHILDWLIENKSQSYHGYCWGYNFDWQSRAFFIPKGIPNVVCTTFIANTFLDSYESLGNAEYLQIARSSCAFILNDLNIAEKGDTLCFSYTPLDQIQVHNANLLAAALLSRVYRFTKERRLLEFSSKAARFSVEHQNVDGSWYYGEAKHQGWVDNFHTGYNLVALKKYEEYSGDKSFHENLMKGYDFYKKQLFTEEDLPKYYHNSFYPLDIHTCAVSIIVFLEFDEIDRAEKTLRWTIDKMWNKKGYFNYQITRFYKNTIPYMRWSQAWMFYAMSKFLSIGNREEEINESLD